MWDNEEWGEMETHNRLAQLGEGMWLVGQLAFWVVVGVVQVPLRMITLWRKGRV